MRTVVLLFSLFFTSLFFTVGIAAAQDFPKGEVFAGYSYGNLHILTDRTSVNGWNASATVNVSRWFGLTTDFGGLYGGSGSEVLNPIFTETVHERLHTLLFGPQVTYRRGKVALFAHLLVGETILNEQIATTGCSTICPVIGSSRTSSGTATPGGGLDFSVGRNLAWRVQADYLPIGAGNDVRISTGLVFRIGK
jgi:hypothetical protein